MRADIEKLKNLVDGISRKTKEPVTEHVKGKCNEILNSFFSEIKSRQLKTLDCRAIMSKPRANRSILLLKQLKKLLEMYSQELNNDLDKKVLNWKIKKLRLVTQRKTISKIFEFLWRSLKVNRRPIFRSQIGENFSIYCFPPSSKYRKILAASDKVIESCNRSSSIGFTANNRR